MTNWTEKNTADDIEFIINNLLDFMTERRLDDYNNGWIEEDDLTTELVECGFTKADAMSIYGLEE